MGAWRALSPCEVRGSSVRGHVPSLEYLEALAVTQAGDVRSHNADPVQVVHPSGRGKCAALRRESHTIGPTFRPGVAQRRNTAPIGMGGVALASLKIAYFLANLIA